MSSLNNKQPVTSVPGQKPMLVALTIVVVATLSLAGSCFAQSTKVARVGYEMRLRSIEGRRGEAQKQQAEALCVKITTGT